MVEKRRAVAVEVCFGGFKDDKKLAVDSKKKATHPIMELL